MLCTSPAIRAAAISCRVQPALFTSHQASNPPSSTSSPSPLRREHFSTVTSRPILFTKSCIVPRNSSSLGFARLASTATSPSTSIPNSSSANGAQVQKLDWNTFFKLRKTRRWYQLGSSITTGICGFVGGASLLTRSDMDAIVSQIPLDPFVTLGLITFTCGGVGWLLGPVLGTGLFNTTRLSGGRRQLMDEREKEFYRKIKRWRVDPSASSMANPVPDYYGEKISSVAGYRQWLKDQRAFNKKRTTYIKY